MSLSQKVSPVSRCATGADSDVASVAVFVVSADTRQMRGKTELRRNVNICPWQNRPTHSRNKQIQVHGDLPLSFGYCSQDLG